MQGTCGYAGLKGCWARSAHPSAQRWWAAAQRDAPTHWLVALLARRLSAAATASALHGRATCIQVLCRWCQVRGWWSVDLVRSGACLSCSVTLSSTAGGFAVDTHCFADERKCRVTVSCTCVHVVCLSSGM